MMTNHRIVVALCGFVLLAGCGGFSAFDNKSTTEDLTPAPVPEDSMVAPGVSATDGEATVVNADQLLTADADQRSADGYRITRTVSIRGANWTTQINRDRQVAADGTLFERLNINSSGPLSPTIGRSELWSNGSTVYVRTFDGTGNRIEQGALPSAPIHFQRWTKLRGQVLEASTYKVEPTSDGAILRSTEISTLPATLVPLSVREPRNVTVQLVVTESGLIRSLRVQYDATVEGEPVQVVIRHQIQTVGNVSVDRPTWIG